MTKAVTILLPLLAAGCMTMPEQPEPRGPCRIDEALRMRYVGTEFRMDMRDDIRAMADAPVARILREDDVVTQEFNPYRLNIRLDDLKRIEGLTCG